MQKTEPSNILPKTEHRRKYFQEMVEELKLLYDIPHGEAVTLAERVVTYLQAKVKHEDPINLGIGSFTPKTLQPRAFNMIVGDGPTNRKRGLCGKRVVWKLKLFKRARNN